MNRSVPLVFVLIFLTASCIVTIQPVKAQSPEYITINADGSVEGTDKIQRYGNIYTFASNVEGAIVIEGSNVVLDGAGGILQGEITINGNNVETKNLKIYAPVNAIEIYGSGCSILENEIQADRKGIRIRNSNNNVISGNKIDAKVEAGIALETSSNNTVKENNITSSIVEGVSLTHSNFNIFSGNDINFVSTYSSSNNTFAGNNFPQGLKIRHSSDYNNVTGNSIIDYNQLTETSITSSGSISIESSEGNLISSNIIVNSGGIFLDTSSNNVLRNNTISNNGIGFEVSGSPQPSLSSFINDIDDSNTINTKKIYYLIGKSDLSINPSSYPNIGYLALVNCTRITAQNLNLNIQGILLAWTSDSIITNNNISKCYGNGVILNYAVNNNITGNNINANDGVGIAFSYSNQNIVSGNSITRNQLGISFIYLATNNTITQNNIADQDTGIYFVASSNNLIYHNNVVNNTKQVYDAYWETRGQPFSYILPSVNIWDNGVEGNYWSNHNCTDGDGDGIGNTPYTIDENNTDYYPLMQQVDISVTALTTTPSPSPTPSSSPTQQPTSTQTLTPSPSNSEQPTNANPDNTVYGLIAAGATVAIVAVAIALLLKRRPPNKN